MFELAIINGNVISVIEKNIGELDFTIGTFINQIKKDASDIDIILLGLLYRELGRDQKSILYNRTVVDALEVNGRCFIESSTIMHSHNYDWPRLNEYTTKISGVFQKYVANTYIVDDGTISHTSDVIDKLIDNIDKLSPSLLKKEKIIMNFLRAIKIRISFESQLKKMSSVKTWKFNSFGQKTEPIKFNKTIHSKHSKIEYFYNKYGNILNQLSHSFRSTYYKFLDINEVVLNEAEKTLDEFITKNP